MEEIFRFTVARSPRRQEPKELKKRSISVDVSDQTRHWLELSTTKLHQAARQYLEAAKATQKNPRFWPALTRFSDWLLTHSHSPNAALEAAVTDIFGHPSLELISKREFLAAWQSYGDSMLALSVVDIRHGELAAELLRGLRVMELLRRLARVAPHREVLLALSAKLVLPRLGTAQKTAQVRPAAAEASKVESWQRLQSDLRKLSGLALRQKATLQQSTSKVGPKQQVRRQLLTRRKLKMEDLSVLSEGSRQLIASKTRGRQKSFDLRDAQTALEAAIAALGVMPTFIYIPQRAPSSRGVARIAGITDLLLVRQTHTRYLPGEISHIENVLPGEKFSRQFRRATTIESIEETETEREEGSERELQSTSRSELRNEVRRSLEERLSLEAGVNVSYQGPGIEVGVDAGFSYDRSTQEASESASLLAREVVDRATTRIVERSRNLRSSRRQVETEDLASRSQDNQTGAPIVGVYRWVDRVVGFEVLNYDRRTMVEMVVPEPSAYYRFVSSSRPTEGAFGAAEPVPMLADDRGWPTGSGELLRPDQLDEVNYLAWVARYGVAGVHPPPPLYTTVAVGVGLEEPPDGGSSPGDSRAKVLENNLLAVPDGYVGTDVEVVVASEYDAADHFYDIKVGSATIKVEALTYYIEGSFGDSIPLTGSIPVSLLAKNYENLTANILVGCTRTPRRFEVWQVETYNSILAEYRRQLAEFQDKVRSTRAQQQIASTSAAPPATLQEFVRVEIKRGAIQAISGQNFDLFDAVRPSADGAPIDVDQEEARAEGAYVQFLEQAFEWPAMSFALYPYFWGRKADWSKSAFASHSDALFGRFLRAGSARVVVPIRPGFEAAVKYFLEQGKPWLGGEAPVLRDTPPAGDSTADAPDVPPYLSVVDEMTEQLGLVFRDLGATVQTVEGSPEVQIQGVEVQSDWESRKVLVDKKTYRITSIRQDAGSLTLDRPFESLSGVYPFGMGPKVVGVPWETTVPTNLVILDGVADNLPEITL